MSKSGSRRRRVSSQNLNSDRISDLPGNVLENILMCLPIRDAVRTSILSSKWRNKWSDAPQLVFDNTFQPIREQVWDNTCLMSTIYEVLLLHSGPIHKFTLSVPGLQSCPEIDRLILFLSREGIQDFELCISRGERHKLPSCLFSCLQLKQLNLRLCEFIPPPAFKGFSNLVCLKLRRVEFPPNFKSFISNFPVLEELMLYRCTNVSCLEITCPNLEILYYNGSYKSLRFINVPCLAYVAIYNTEEANTKSKGVKIPSLAEFVHSLPALKYLSVDHNFLKSLVVRDALQRIQAPLKILKTIRLFYLCFAELEEISSLLGLLRNSPNLQKLQIELYAEADLDANALVKSLRMLEGQDLSEFSLDQLQEVKLQRFHGTKPEVEFIKFLLAKSSSLKTMRVQPDEYDMPSEDQLEIFKEIIRFRRSSPTAEIICEDFVQEYEDITTM